MTLRILVSTLIPLLTATLSCKRDDDAAPPAPPIDPGGLYASYSRLDSGNYWVYGYFTLDSTGTVLGPANMPADSDYVEKDTIIRGQTFHTLVSYSRQFGDGDRQRRHLRDSLHYIVDDRGTIFFAAQDFTTEFYRKYLVDPGHQISPADTFALIVKKMSERDKMFTVPAGTFATSSMRTTWTLDESLPRSQYPSPRRLDVRYSPTAGLVSETLPFFAMQLTYTERMLLRYRVR